MKWLLRSLAFAGIPIHVTTWMKSYTMYAFVLCRCGIGGQLLEKCTLPRSSLSSATGSSSPSFRIFCVDLPLAPEAYLDVEYSNWMRLQWSAFTKAKVRRFDGRRFDDVVPQNQNAYSLQTFLRTAHTRSLKFFCNDWPELLFWLI